MWTAPDLEPYASWAEHHRRISKMGVLNAGNQVAIMVPGAGLGLADAELWTLDVISGRFTITQRLPGVEFAGLVRLSDVDYLISTPDSLIPLSAPRLGSDPVTLGQPVEAESTGWAGPTWTSQGDALVSATGSLRLWTLQNLAEEGIPVPVRTRREQFMMGSLAVSESLVYASTADGQAHAWNIDSGEAWRLEVSPGAPVSTVGAFGGSGHVILGLESGELQAWDGDNGRLLWRANAGLKVISVQVLQLDGRMIALAAVRLGWNLHVCRIWDMESGIEIESRDLDLLDEPGLKGYEWNLAVAGYRRDKEVTDLAATDTPYGPVAAITSHASAVIPVWSLATQEHIAELQVLRNSRPLPLAFAPGYLFAGGTNGDLLGWRMSKWWHARHDQLVTSRAKRAVINTEYPIHLPDILIPQAHYGPVQALTGGTWNGRPCAVTGGRDGRLHAWAVTGERLATVDIGDPVTTLVNAGHERYAAGSERGLVMIESN
jgi:WD40 repeat protein